MFSCTENKSAVSSDHEAVSIDTVPSVERGKYLVSISGCNDCHSPKMMTAQGPVPDPAKILSGHPSDEKTAPFDTVTTKGWLLFSMGLTSAKGPWGTSFAANLTPDETGIGNWSEENFLNAFQKGDFKGMPGGRKLLPPMPWQEFANMTRVDARSVFMYLKSLPPVKNIVPNALPPGQ